MTTRSLCVLVASLLVAAPIRAQSRGGVPPNRFGVVGGANLASMTETKDTRRVTGAYVGGQVVLPRTTYLSMQLELAWSQKGVRAAGRDLETGEEIEITVRNSYLEMPILMRLDSPLAIGVDPVGAIPFVVAGPSLGISVRCALEGQSAERRTSYDCDDEFGVKTFDFGAMLGAGLDAPIGRTSVSLSARYTIGLQDTFDGTGGRNRTIMLLAGVNF